MLNPNDNISKGASLYHYTSIASLVRILENMKLKISKYQDANDLSEVGRFLSVAPLLSVQLQDFIKNKCGYISFSRDYYLYHKGKRHPLVQKGYFIPTMWAYYADANRGVCIVLNEDILKHNYSEFRSNTWLQNVKYKRFISKDNLAYEDGQSCEDIIRNNHTKLFFYKHKSWSHERERRLCFVNAPQYISIINCIEKVILGSNVSTNDKMHIISMINDERYACYNQLAMNQFYMQSEQDGISSALPEYFDDVNIEVNQIKKFIGE